MRHYPPQRPKRNPAAHARFARATRKQGQCQRCGSTTRLQAHHHNGDRTDNRPENGILLCERCHRQTHQGGE